MKKISWRAILGCGWGRQECNWGPVTPTAKTDIGGGQFSWTGIRRASLRALGRGSRGDGGVPCSRARHAGAGDVRSPRTAPPARLPASSSSGPRRLCAPLPALAVFPTAPARGDLSTPRPEMPIAGPPARQSLARALPAGAAQQGGGRVLTRAAAAAAAQLFEPQGPGGELGLMVGRRAPRPPPI